MLLGLKYDETVHSMWGVLGDDTKIRDYDADTMLELDVRVKRDRLTDWYDINPEASHTLDPNLGIGLVENRVTAGGNNGTK